MTRATQESVGHEIEALNDTLMPGEVMTTLAEEFYAMPSTRGQERFWSLDQLNPGNPALNMPLMWKCTGPLDLDILSEAFRQVVERHESLRTTFDVVDGRVVQVIGPAWVVPIPVVDLSGEAGGEASARARQLTNEHAAFRMDLRAGPLLVVKLLRFSPENHLLLVTLHHIICDGVSTGVLLRDVASVYEALSRGVEVKLPELPLQLADFAIWQEEWRQTPAYAASLNFWRKSLGKNFSKIELRHDADRSSVAAGRKEAGDIETLLLGSETAAEVHEFCRRNFITYNVFFFSVFSLLLSRISGQRDLLIGSPVANRVEKTEDLVGMFMNIQAVRVKLEEGDSFRTLVDKVQEWTIQASDNQQFPFEDLVYDPHFSSGHSSFELPIFFLYQKSFMVTHKIGDLTIVPLRSMSPGAAFEIMFAVVDREGEGPRLQLEFNPRKFKRETIEQYLKLYVALLESALRTPAELLDLLGAGSQEMLLPAVLAGGVDQAESRQGEGQAETATSSQTAEGAARQQLAAEHRTFRDAIEFQLVEIWQDTLGIPYISVDDGFFSLGVSSLSALRLITKMNRVYSTNLGLSSLFSAPTIAATAELIRERLSPNMHSSLVPIQPLGSKKPLFVVHGVLGNILSFYGLATHLGKDQPVYGIQAQSLVTGEPALLRLQDMARYYIGEMRKVQPTGPYHLLGYSFGGTMAMEMAQQLRAASQEVGLLGMLDSKSPDYMKALAQTGAAIKKIKAAERKAVVEETQATFAEKVEQLASKVRGRLIRISCQLGMAAGFKTIPAFMKDPWSINYVANLKYAPYLYDGRLTLFRAARQSNPYASKDLGWTPLFTGGVDVRELPGTHETLWSEQNIEAFATSLAEALEHKEVGELQRVG